MSNKEFSSDYEIVMAYHHQSKHHLEHYALGPEHINWEQQPSGFRYWQGCEQVNLPLVADSINTRFADLYHAPKSKYALNIKTLSGLLELSFGLSAWKQFGEARWSLRCNPSSGNLHPTESYIITTNLNGIKPGVYHYVSENHVLEQRGIINDKWANLLPESGFLLGLSSIPWREMWKYGERSFRYCHHDIGHALAAIRYAAACFGWRVFLLSDWSDAEVTTLLGLDQEQVLRSAEREVAELMLWIDSSEDAKAICIRPQLAELLTEIKWFGEAKLLNQAHDYDWPTVNQVIEHTKKNVTVESASPMPKLPPLPVVGDFKAVDLIRQRRSAQHFDGKTVLKLQYFYRILDSTIPRDGSHIWDFFIWPPSIHLVLFIHRVEDLDSGLYILARNDNIVEELKEQLNQPQFTWQKPHNCPEHLNFYHLVTANAQNAAMRLACHQNIASRGAFSLGMLSEFTNKLKAGSWEYKRLFWEAGIIGQILYLEAEAAKMRGTGIGCFFDDAVHDILGIQTQDFQSLYHFTIGVPVDDTRLQTIPAYAHLENRHKKI